jgi:hypothetical protein
MFGAAEGVVLTDGRRQTTVDDESLERRSACG